MLKIAAEWVQDDKYHIEFFHSWAAYHAATFDPDIILKRLVIWQGAQRKEVSYND